MDCLWGMGWYKSMALAWGTDFIHMNDCGVKDVHQLRAKAKTKFNSYMSYMLKSFCSGFHSVHRQSWTVSEGNLWLGARSTEQDHLIWQSNGRLCFWSWHGRFLRHPSGTSTQTNPSRVNLHLPLASTTVAVTSLQTIGINTSFTFTPLAGHLLKKICDVLCFIIITKETEKISLRSIYSSTRLRETVRLSLIC